MNMFERAFYTNLLYPLQFSREKSFSINNKFLKMVADFRKTKNGCNDLTSMRAYLKPVFPSLTPYSGAKQVPAFPTVQKAIIWGQRKVSIPQSVGFEKFLRTSSAEKN